MLRHALSRALSGGLRAWEGSVGISSATRCESVGGSGSVAGSVCRQLRVSSAAAAAQPGTPTPPQATISPETTASICSSFASCPESASAVLLEALDPVQRGILLNELQKRRAEGRVHLAEGEDSPDESPEALFTHADRFEPLGALDRKEFRHALTAHHAYITSTVSDGPTVTPTRKQLMQVALAASIPFVGFGFLDNFIMLIAGDQIDHTLCARFGLSTLAAAGLGNLLSDIFGVITADSLEQQAKKSIWSKPPRLSQAQQRMRQVLLARTTGNVLGISFGCFLGMAPLLFMDAE